MAFQVLHMQKINHAALSGIQSHNRREHESKTNKDIDHSLSGKNFELENISNGITYNRAFKNRLVEVGYTRKLRSDVVGCGSFVISASAEFFNGKTEDEVKQYFKDASEFVKGKYGAENVLYANVHMDEATPHLHLGIVPITKNGKLSAKEVFNKQNGFDKLQEDFNNYLQAKGYDLEKGQKTENTKHLSEIEYKVQQEQKKLEQIQEKRETLQEQINEKIEFLEKLESTDAYLTQKIQQNASEVGLIKKEIKLPKEDFQKLIQQAEISPKWEIKYKIQEEELDRTKRNLDLSKSTNNNLREENTNLKNEIRTLKQMLQDELKNLKEFVQEKGLWNVFKQWREEKRQKEITKQRFSKEIEI
jgi:hypothetical protein